ncbi:MAG: RimK family protein [Planctomycetes bacterium]|nr:RimK family protein [Planctomycetota bacterium]
MTTLIVVNRPEKWPLEIPGVQVVAARTYLTDRRFSDLKGTKVFNLCRHYAYQRLGYYVSLLAEARGHRPMPDINTIMNLRNLSMPRGESQELDEEIQRVLKPIKGDEFTLSIYFGRNMAARYKRLALMLFNLFPAPFLRAEFVRENDWWSLTHIGTIPFSEVPDPHRDFVQASANSYLSRDHRRPSQRNRPKYDLAVLYDPAETHKPSNDRAIKRFCDAAWDLGINTELIGKSDYGRLAEFDALFIRETTAVNHHTYRFSRRAANLGLVVIDDPLSILRCTNKVYLAELLDHAEIPAPRTVIAHEDNLDDVIIHLGLPCVLKRPDGAFSQGVMKAADVSELRGVIEAMLEDSELVIAQEWMPTEYDWRIGVLDGRPLYACRYHMAKEHWQIAKHDGSSSRYGKVEPVAIHEAPPKVVEIAVKATRLIGRSLYGVDIKEVSGKPHIIEVNDNPNLDAGYEDAILKDELWRRIADVFRQRIEAQRDGAAK